MSQILLFQPGSSGPGGLLPALWYLCEERKIGRRLMINRRQFLTGTLALAVMPRRSLALEEPRANGMTLAEAASKARLLFGSPLFPNDILKTDYLKLFS